MAVEYTDNLIPKMTSDTSPSGESSASSIWDNSFSAWKAFDESYDGTNGTWSARSSLPQWIQYKFKEHERIKKYSITSRNNNIRTDPKSWEFLGSNDGVNWVVLDTQDNVNNWSQNERRDFIIENKIAYQYYRLNILDSYNIGNSSTTASVGELEMYDTKQQNKILLLSEDGKYKVIKSQKIKTETSVPNMSGNTSPEGKVEASTVYRNNHPYNAFNNSANYWGTGNSSLGHAPSISYEFDSPKRIVSYSIFNNNSARKPSKWEFKGYDGQTWYILDSQKDIVNWDNTPKYFLIDNKKEYLSYMLDIHESIGGSNGMRIDFIGFYEEEQSATIAEVSEYKLQSEGIHLKDFLNIDLESKIAEKHYNQDNSTRLSNGKVFKQKLDTNKIIKNLKIKLQRGEV